MMWRVNRESILFAAAARALLLQLAHPWVAAAIADHSQAVQQPIRRFHRTFAVVFAQIFGTLDQALAAARGLHRRHSQVTGTLKSAIGAFEAGSAYCANNVAALRWVHATLIDSAVVAHDLLLAPLTEDMRERYFADSRLFAALFGIPQNALPANYREFAGYVDQMLESPVLTVSPVARQIGRQLLAGNDVSSGMPAGYRGLTMMLLPERLRDEFGLHYWPAERRAIAWGRAVYPLLPARLRYVAPYHEAMERLAGRPAPTLTTQLLNRFWIGGGSLGQ
jgi:uncharacterized protein (DUF2236 family)